MFHCGGAIASAGRSPRNDASRLMAFCMRVQMCARDAAIHSTNQCAP